MFPSIPITFYKPETNLKPNTTYFSACGRSSISSVPNGVHVVEKRNIVGSVFPFLGRQ